MSISTMKQNDDEHSDNFSLKARPKALIFFGGFYITTGNFDLRNFGINGPKLKRLDVKAISFSFLCIQRITILHFK